MWFYLDGEQRRGPVTVEELVNALVASPSPRNVRIWREGMPDWQDAGSVPEIDKKLRDSVPIEDAEQIAKFYRFLVLLVGLQLLIGIFQLSGKITPALETGTFALVIFFAFIFLLAATAFTAYHLTHLLGESWPILWGMAMLVPCLNIIGLLMISTRAQVWCKRYGIEVGFFGPTKESIKELSHRRAGSRFN